MASSPSNKAPPFPLCFNLQVPNSNAFPRGRNLFPLDVTSTPDNDNRIPHNDNLFPVSDNRFPLNDNAFPDNDNGRRSEFPVPGPLIPANSEKFAAQAVTRFADKLLFLRGKLSLEIKELGRKRQNSL